MIRIARFAFCLASLSVSLSLTSRAEILHPLIIWDEPEEYIIDRRFCNAQWNVSMFGNSNSGSATYFLDIGGYLVHRMAAFADRSWDRIVMLESDDITTFEGRFIEFGSHGTGVDQFKTPEEIKLMQYVNMSYNPPRQIGYYSIYVADRDNDRVEHYEYHFFPLKDGPYRANSMTHANLRMPTDFDIDNNGEWLNNNNHILWSNSALNKIVGFDMYAGLYLTSYGQTGSGVGQFNQIQSIACGRRAMSHNINNDTIYVVDRGNSRVVMLRWDGTTMHWLKAWNSYYAAYITDLAVDYFGCLWATTTLPNVIKFTAQLEPLGTFGQLGTGIGDLKEPLSITDGGGEAGWYNLLICERWDDSSGIRYYVPSPEIMDLFMQTTPVGLDCDVTIVFTLVETSELKIEVFDANGVKKRSLLPAGQIAQAGVQSFFWNGRDDSGNRVPAGQYRIKITSTGFGIDENSVRLTVSAEGWVAVCQQLTCSWKVGDADGNGGYSIADAVYLQNYMFSGGTPPTPHPVGSGDADCSNSVSIADIVYLVNFIFSGGTPPGNPDGIPPANCTCDDYQ